MAIEKQKYSLAAGIMPLSDLVSDLSEIIKQDKKEGRLEEDYIATQNLMLKIGESTYQPIASRGDKIYPEQYSMLMDSYRVSPDMFYLCTEEKYFRFHQIPLNSR